MLPATYPVYYFYIDCEKIMNVNFVAVNILEFTSYIKLAETICFEIKISEIKFMFCV